MKDLHKQLENFYLDWVNNFVSIAAFASHYGLEENHAQLLLSLAREIVERGNVHN